MDKYTWGDAEEALRDALKMEKFVTKEIKTIIDVCSDADSNVSRKGTKGLQLIFESKIEFMVQILFYFVSPFRTTTLPTG